MVELTLRSGCNIPRQPQEDIDENVDENIDETLTK
jgi:hypothetical protein